ncbi:hypothetical protein V0R37_15125 [Pollutimonas sp. H1-120]|uniref:hypothetical protein n=1 Tax=Pollutimonas sp. H1-120 TaxID=3148824 RepID=UPI003B51F554
MNEKTTGKKRVGRPAVAETAEHRALLGRQALVFRTIQSLSGLSNAQLDRLFTGITSKGNEGKAWRRWVAGEQRCLNFNEVCDVARSNGWLNDVATSALEHADLSAEAWAPIVKRQSRFQTARAELNAALQRFREVCEAEHNEYSSIWQTGEIDAPATAVELTRMFDEAQAHVQKLNCLAIAIEPPKLPKDPSVPQYIFGPIPGGSSSQPDAYQICTKFAPEL